MQLPTLARIEAAASSITRGGFLGVDIGTSSVKIVQLSMRDGAPVLDTYGEIDLGPYSDRAPHRAVRLDPPERAAAVLDLLHAVDGSARKSGISLALPSALLSLIHTPVRDRDQMQKLIATDAQRYIPVPLESVQIDWVVLGDEAPHEDAFERAASGESAKPRTQDVLLVALPKETINSYGMMAAAAGLDVGFYELEIFSAGRACASSGVGAALLFDLGASNLKLCVVSGQGMPLAAHVVPGGGEMMTEAIMKACDWPFEKAESAKRERGFGSSPSYTQSENDAMTRVMKEILGGFFAEASHFIEDTANKRELDVMRIVLLGGGARCRGIVDETVRHFKKDVVLAEPFSQVHAPMILEATLKEAGPSFATALGLALRGIRT